jgi:hypothetical protein
VVIAVVVLAILVFIGVRLAERRKGKHASRR